uniref:PfkB family carbohydrate kinase n=1 Tax=Treponema sp. TaxID=166 RepID=UPI00298E8DDD
MKVLSFGSLNIDSVYKVDHIVTPGETQLSFEINENCGGKGLNQSIALARAGAEVYHAGMVGDDGDIFIKKCLENG